MIINCFVSFIKIVFNCIVYVSLELVKGNQLYFDMIQYIDCFYEKEYEMDKQVRGMWYLYCYHFLTKVNKNWRDCLQGSLIHKKTNIFKHISTSDEALVLWLIRIWEPKIKNEFDNGWPIVQKTKEKAKQELKTGLKDYIQYYNKIYASKKVEDGNLALRWNLIFWEELVANNPSIFDTTNAITPPTITNESKKFSDSLFLPGVDDDNAELLDLFNKSKSINTVNASNSCLVPDGLPQLNSNLQINDNDDKTNTGDFALENNITNIAQC